jgi:hypothetical protein
LIKRFLLAVGAVALCVAPAVGSQQDFSLHNHTGRTLKQLFVRPAGTDTWGQDIMGSSAVADGGSVDITFARDEDQCKWDVRGGFGDGSYAEVRDVDFCIVSDVTFNP